MNKRFPPRYSPENYPLEGLDPPWIPGWTQPVEDYDGGIPARLAEGGLLCVVDPWTQMKEGDTFKFYWNDTTTPVWSTEIDLDQKNQRLVFRIDESHIVRGDTFPVFYSVLRVGGTTAEESDPQWKLLVKLDPPGGFDEEQGTPGHSGLRYSIPQDIIDNGVGSDNTDGVPITIKPYLFMRRNDKINVAWGSENVNHTVAEGEVDQEITITVSREVIERAGDGDGVAVAYQVVDECGNYPGGYWRWSATTPILVDLNNDRLDPPLVLVNDVPVEEVDLEDLAGNPVIVRVNANRYEHEVGDILRLTWRGISADGFSVIVGPLEETVETIPYFYDFTIPYDDVAAIARGRASVAYVRVRSGEADRPSKSTAVTVVGDNRRYGPPGIVEAVGNTLDPDLDFYTLSVPYYSGRVPGDQILIVCEGLTAVGHPTYHDVSVIVTGEAVGAPVLGNLPKAQVQRLDGGSLKVYYSVNGQPASDVLELTVGVAAPSLPIPTVDEAPDDVLDPDNVNPAIGANVIVPYTGTIPDDVVVLRWRGSSSNAPDDPRTLTQNTAGDPVPFTVPFSYVSGNLNGTVDVSYSVTRGTTLLGNSVVRHLRVGSAQLIDPTIDSVEDLLGNAIVNGGMTTATSVILRGKALEDQKVAILDGETWKGSADVNASGDWNQQVTGLAVDAHNFKAHGLYGSNPESEVWTVNVQPPMVLDPETMLLDGIKYFQSYGLVQREVPNNTGTRIPTGGVLPYRYTSLDPQIASVSDAGKVIGLRNGETTIVVEDSVGAEARYGVVVENIFRLLRREGPTTAADVHAWAREIGGAPTQLSGELIEALAQNFATLEGLLETVPHESSPDAKFTGVADIWFYPDGTPVISAYVWHSTPTHYGSLSYRDNNGIRLFPRMLAFEPINS